MGLESYGFEEHSHRYAVWAAHRAAFRGHKGAKAENISGWFRKVEYSDKSHLLKLSVDQKTFDQAHRRWRQEMITKSEAQDGVDALSHGRAAKAINIYLKTRYVLTDPCCRAAFVIHPPVDRLFLNAIQKQIPELKPAVWMPNKGRVIPWTKLDCEAYEELIAKLRAVSPKEPFWKMEFCWSPEGPR